MCKIIKDVKIVETIGEYTIVKIKEIMCSNNGKYFGMGIWHDICLDGGEGDIVASFRKLKDARKWAKS